MNKKKSFLFLYSALCTFVGIFLFFSFTSAAPVDTYGGFIVIQTEKNGEAWYVHPLRNKRFYLGSKKQMLRALRSGAVGVDRETLQKIPRAKDDFSVDADVFDYYGGRIILNPYKDGVAWYVHPQTGKRYKLENKDDVKKIIQKFSVGIKNKKLKRIPKGSSKMRFVRYSDSYITTKKGTFRTRIVKVPRKKFTLETISTNTKDCGMSCTAQTLKQFVKQRKGIAGINGTYFCVSCGIADYSFLSPLFHSGVKKMINEYKLPFHNGPLLIVTKNGSYHYFHRSIDFGWTQEEFEEETGKKIIAGISNYPALLENDIIMIHDEPLESSMVTRRIRSAVGYNDRFLSFVTVESATVEDVAYMMKKIGNTYALNMDGGTSTALFLSGLYKSGPGRLLPNALIIK